MSLMKATLSAVGINKSSGLLLEACLLYARSLPRRGNKCVDDSGEK